MVSEFVDWGASGEQEPVSRTDSQELLERPKFVVGGCRCIWSHQGRRLVFSMERHPRVWQERVPRAGSSRRLVHCLR
jgi:hypothetical protein